MIGATFPGDGRSATLLGITMTNSRPVSTRTGQGQHWRGIGAACLAACFACGVATHVLAQAPAAPAAAAAPSPAAEIDKLVGPIALYPDDLVAIILPASTNPLQLVQADRFLEKRKTDPKLEIDSKWDDAVKSLLNYPDVVKMMSADLDWTSALGEAVVADQGAVLEGIQRFRRQAQAAGNLKSDGKQVVKTDKEIVIIEPADPQVIYVPQYNPTTVVVYSATPVYAYYPTPYPSYYYPYPPGAAFATGVIWGAAIGAAWSGNHYNTSYSGNVNINVNNTTNINTGNINTGNINTGNINTGNTNVNRSGGTSQQSAGSSTAWSSNKQPGQVSSSVGKTAPTARAGSAQSAGGTGAAAGATAKPSTQTAGGASKQSASGAGATTSAAARQSTQPSGGGNAFDGYGSGRSAQMDSSRGAASTSSMSSAGARSGDGGGGRRSGGRR
jgi:hypothetical protein